MRRGNLVDAFSVFIPIGSSACTIRHLSQHAVEETNLGKLRQASLGLMTGGTLHLVPCSRMIELGRAILAYKEESFHSLALLAREDLPFEQISPVMKQLIDWRTFWLSVSLLCFS